MKVIYYQDNYIAEVRLIDFFKVLYDKGEYFTLEIIETIQPGWFGSYPNGKMLSLYKNPELNELSWSIKFIVEKPDTERKEHGKEKSESERQQIRKVYL